MKIKTLALTLSTLLSISSGAHALELIVVNNYNAAGSPEIWKKAKTDQVPGPLLSIESIHSPIAAYAGMFPKTFMQEDLFAVCHKSCNDKDIFRVRGDEIDSKDLKKWDVVEQSNVYYWLKKYFKFLDTKINFQVEYFLKVMTDRELRDETKGKVMKNNAFFNPKDVSLSFLPATKNFLYKIMGGKINRSGFDPSVVVHEASHYLFHHLFPNPVNDEIGGLNEGFADYMANIFLNNPKLGLVMMHGQTLRDSSQQFDKDGRLKMYEPGMEVHDLGERVSYALWKTRELSSDKEEMDRLVIDAIQDLGRNPYSTVHDFKVKMLARLPSVISGTSMRNVKTIWEMALSGSPESIANLSFLDKSTRADSYIGFSTRQVLPEALAREFGTSAVEEANFSIVQMENISATQIAILMATETSELTTPYWVAIDALRGNILGIYSLNKELITDKEDLQKLIPLASKAKGALTFAKDFKAKIKSFTDLSLGKGDLNAIYKAKNVKSSEHTLTFNGMPVKGHRVHMKLKRRLLTGVLFGMPEIKSIELYTLPISELTSLPLLEQERVVGYGLTLKTGTVTEVILNKHALK